MRLVLNVAKSDAHVVEDGSRNGNGDADSEDGVSNREWIDIARVNKEKACGKSPDKRERREDGIREMSERKDGCGEKSGEVGIRNKTQSARKEISLK